MIIFFHSDAAFYIFRVGFAYFMYVFYIRKSDLCLTQFGHIECVFWQRPTSGHENVYIFHHGEIRPWKNNEPYTSIAYGFCNTVSLHVGYLPTYFGLVVGWSHKQHMRLVWSDIWQMQACLSHISELNRFHSAYNNSSKNIFHKISFNGFVVL